MAGTDVTCGWRTGASVIGGQSCVVLNEKSLDKLPWSDLAVDVVLECTGAFTRQEDLERHVEAGARYVILSAPVEGADVPTVVHGVNRAMPGRASSRAPAARPTASPR